jgi:Spy/CpxP family protein refolding chaperone
MRVVSMALALIASLVIVGNLSAAEEKRGPEGRRPGGPMMEQWDMLKEVSLTDDQKVKVEEVKKEYGPKLKEARQKMDGILTEDQKKARTEAMKAARAAGKDRQEARKEVEAAVKLTDDQKAKMAEAKKGVDTLRKEAREKILALLTPEQKEQLKKERGHGRPHRPEGK